MKELASTLLGGGPHYPAENAPEGKLIILDDIFPHLLSAFRITEFNCYLERYASAEVYTTTSAFGCIHEQRSYSEILDEYERTYPQFRNRVRVYDRKKGLRGALVYTLFLNNAYSFIDAINKSRLQFVFTLYPGGGFHIDQQDTHKKLARVLSSPNLRKVIVTQKLSYEYLLNKNYCDPRLVEFLYGGIFPSYSKRTSEKKRYPMDKDTLDICFVAHKYTERGVDKGYDVFIETARKLSKARKNIFFHVVGPFQPSDIEVSDLRERIRFYGTRNTLFFSDFYSGMDIILSPNVPFVLAPGQFDGFPTGCCIEAGLNGVAVFCADTLNQNIAFKDQEEIVITSRSSGEITDSILDFYDRSDDLRRLAEKGEQAFRTIFSRETQMMPRLRILSEYLGDTQPLHKGAGPGMQ